MIDSLIDAARDVAVRYGYDRVDTCHLLHALLLYPEISTRVRKKRGHPIAFRSSLEDSFRENMKARGAPANRVILSDAVIRCLEAAKNTDDPLVSAYEISIRSSSEPVQRALNAAALNFPDNAPEPAFQDEMGELLPDLDALLEEQASADIFDQICDDVFGNVPQSHDITPPKMYRKSEQGPDAKNQEIPAPDYEGDVAPEPKQTRSSSSGGNPSLSERERAEAKRAVERSTRDLSAAWAAGELDVIHGRDEEISLLCEVLLRRRKSNALLVGDPGVGKTALIEGLAAHMAQSKDPALKERPLLQVSLGGLVSGARYRGDFEVRIDILLEIAREKRAVVFFDEMQMLMGSGSTAERGMDGANLLKPALARDDISLIGATTTEEAEIIRSDKALMRRFEMIRIREPKAGQMVEILRKASKSYLTHHNVEIKPERFDQIIRLADQYLPGRNFPDKAFDILDGACVFARISSRSHVSAADIRHAVRNLGGRLPYQDEAAQIGIPLTRSRIRHELSELIGGHDEALDVISEKISERRYGYPLFLDIKADPKVGAGHLARSIAKSLNLKPVELRTDITPALLREAIREAVRRDPFTLLVLRSDGPSCGEVTSILSSLRERGLMKDNNASDVDVLNGGVVHISTFERASIGFVNSASEASGDAITLRLFSGERLAQAVSFEIRRLSRLWSDMGVSRDIPKIEKMGLKEKGGALNWEGVSNLCLSAVSA